ncbi:hypothetical protein FB45DRAFT_927983 [Roridomyces roridus]|uniref:Uncharacterized protein n=1 Tax=Roridomyces roridus TaxID=1738132 RepID=A0AAD7BHD1_9AGAR|nr:hypothetical protein FB45DRAFT_927983 [Roridomyces roridus]
MYSDSLYPYRVPSYDALDLRLPPLNLDDFPDTLPPPPVPRISGNLDPTTGIFYHMPENPRIRTTQACDSCRSRKAKVGSSSFRFPSTL